MASSREICEERLSRFVETHFSLKAPHLIWAKVPSGRRLDGVCEVLSEGNQYFLKLLACRSLTQSQRIVYVQDYFSQRLEEVPAVVPNREGKLFIRLPSTVSYHPIAFLSYAARGVPEHSWTDPPQDLLKVRSAAALLARFHNVDVPDTEVSSFENWDIQEELRLVVDELESSFGRGASELIRRGKTLEKRLEKSIYQAFPWAPLHGDFHAQNVLFEGSEATGLIDIDGPQFGPRVIDLGYAMAYFSINAFEFRQGKMWLMKRNYDEFLRTYTDVSSQNGRPLSSEEKRLIPLFFEVAAFFIGAHLLVEESEAN